MNAEEVFMNQPIVTSMMLLTGLLSSSAAFGQFQQITKPNLKWPVGGMPTDFRVSRDGTRLAVATEKSQTIVFDLPNGKRAFEVGMNGPYGRVALSSNGRLVACVARDDRDVNIYDIPTGKRVHTFTSHTGDYGQLQFSADDSTLYALQSKEGYRGIVAYNLAKKQVSRLIPGNLRSTQSIFAMTLDHDNAALYYFHHTDTSTFQPQAIGGSSNAYSSDWILVRRDLKTGKEKNIFTHSAAAHRQWGEWVRFTLSPDGKTMLMGPFTIDLVKGVGRKEPDTERMKMGTSYSPDGRYMFTSLGAGTEIFEAKSGEQSLLLVPRVSREVTNKYVPPVLSLDGTKVYTSGDLDEIWVWDIGNFLKANGKK